MGAKVAPLRVVIDTNVMVSALLFGGRPGKLRDLWKSARAAPLVSIETFAELCKVLAYPTFHLSAEEISMLIEDELLPYVEVVEVTENVSGACRDPGDDKFLSLAASGRVSYLVTGDKDLLVLQTYRKTKIVTASDFLSILSGDE